MLEQKGYIEKLEKILEGQEHIVYEDCDLYLVDRKCLDKIELLSLKINRADEDSGDKTKKGAFYHFGKIINPDHPALKFNLKKRHKYRATYDREKIHAQLVRDKSILVHTLKNELEEKITANVDGKYTKQSAELARKELQDRIDIDMQMLEDVVKDFENYDIVVTNFESHHIYAYVYYTYNDGKKTGLGKNEHLRAKVPNILWIATDEYYAHRRKDEKINEMINSHARLLGTIYIKKREEK